MFEFDPSSFQHEFSRRGFVHVKGVLSRNFIDYLGDFYNRSQIGRTSESDEWNIYGKKRQYIFDFPSDQAAFQFREGMAGLAGIDRDAFTISERHLKVYDKHAEAWPVPHKDRAASQVSIGLPVHIPAGSTACMFPDLQFGRNEEERAIFLSGNDHHDPAHVYRTEQAVMLNEQVGDVIAFLGSSIFHERVNPAGAAILYIKVNGEGADPLGENIYADAQA